MFSKLFFRKNFPKFTDTKNNRNRKNVNQWFPRRGSIWIWSFWIRNDRFWFWWIWMDYYGFYDYYLYYNRFLYIWQEWFFWFFWIGRMRVYTLERSCLFIQDFFLWFQMRIFKKKEKFIFRVNPADFWIYHI